MKNRISQQVEEHRQSIMNTYNDLHAIPEWGFNEFKTSAYIKSKLQEVDIAVRDVTETGFIADLKGQEDGPTIGLRADIDALPYKDEAGETYYLHTCGHDANVTMVLWAVRTLKELGLVNKGSLQAIFQPAEERLAGAKAMIETGTGSDLDEFYGVHLRAQSDVLLGQAAAGMLHNASGAMEATFTGKEAHGSRPHLGINAIDAAAMATLAINSLWVNPEKSWSAKVTKIAGGGVATNIIPYQATLAVDIRGEDSDTINEVIAKIKTACLHAAESVGAKAEVKLTGLVPTSEYSPQAMDNLEEAISAILGPEGLLKPASSPGGDDFHEFKVAYPELKTAFLALGADLTPGLHDLNMTFDKEALIIGTKILALAMANRLA